MIQYVSCINEVGNVTWAYQNELEETGMNIGEQIKQLRKQRGLSQEQLAEQLMVSRAAVAKWESNNGVPDIENLKRLSEVFDVTIDELVKGACIISAEQKCSNGSYYAPFIGKKCTVEMIDWNDGIFDSYIVNQDEKFLYYVTIEKKSTQIGALSKRYVERIILSEKKNVADISEGGEVNKEYFVNKTVDIYLEDKKFFSGIFGKDTELLGVGLQNIGEMYVTLVSGVELEVKQITKIETSSAGMGV